MRRKLRYLAFEAVDGEQNIYQAVAAVGKRLGVGKEELKIILQNRDRRQGLLRCGHLMVGDLKRAISEEGVPLRILGVSGTIRAARRKYFPTAPGD